MNPKIKQNFVYRHPKIYTIYLRCSYPFRALSKRLKFISSIIGKQKTVLDAACGPAHLYEYLDRSNTYSGFDLNKTFIDYANKKYSLSLEIKDVTDPKSFKKSDVIVLLDILHHLDKDKRKKAVSNAFSNAKKIVIICEPFLPKFFRKKSFFSKVSAKVFEIFERDGFNHVTVEIGLFEEELENNLINFFDANIDKSVWHLKIHKITGYLVGVYTR